MDKIQENKFSMYLSVQKVTNFHSDVWQELPAFKSRYSIFEKLIETIREVRLVQEGEITGVTKDKADAQQKAVEKGNEIATAVYAYASVNGDLKLKDRVSYSPSKLKLSRDTILIDSLNVIKNEALKKLPELSDYGLIQEDIDELTALIDRYAEVVENPRQSITNRARSTKELKEYMTKADTILKDQLDKLVNQFKVKSPAFFKQYKGARIIIDRGIPKKEKKIEETITEQAA